ncbi:hypothetical protein KO481_38165 [Nocardia sp. NEAU-G5]|uniref:EVE domain-containing protein n=1 Tax=Nocardia albiluteola TaxID=2842303 RepID=A0ABS6BDR7_9NOCA|nr:hypothetical protein [Nocardia albiluteola]MBU3067334.1 hypothetical protein [Nocardia albiluteola]
MDRDAPLTRSSFGKLHPIVTPQPLSQLPDRVWTVSEWDRIQRGCQSRSMDEKWDVFAEGDIVFMHRSWTGHGIYEVSFSSSATGGRKITSAAVETDPQRRRWRSDDFDRVMIELIISGVVLGEPALELRAAFAAAVAGSRSGTTDVSQQATLHNVLGVTP